MSTDNIFVTGATGKIGQHLLSILASGPSTRITAYVRNPSTAPSQLASHPSIKFVQGDVMDTDTFSRSIEGHTRLFLLANNQEIEPKLAKIAKDKGVKQIVKVSCVGASVWEEKNTFLYYHGVAERDVEIEAKGVSLTFLRPTDFMQNLLGSAGSIKGQSAFYNNHGSAATASIDAYDIAACAAAILRAPIDKYEGTSFELTGSESLTWPQVADVLSSKLGKSGNAKVKHVHVDDNSYLKTLMGYGIPERMAFRVMALGHFYRKRCTGNAYFNGNVEYLTGKKARTWSDFFEENKAAFV